MHLLSPPSTDISDERNFRVQQLCDFGQMSCTLVVKSGDTMSASPVLTEVGNKGDHSWESALEAVLSYREPSGCCYYDSTYTNALRWQRREWCQCSSIWDSPACCPTVLCRATLTSPLLGYLVPDDWIFNPPYFFLSFLFSYWCPVQAAPDVDQTLSCPSVCNPFVAYTTDLSPSSLQRVL